MNGAKVWDGMCMLCGAAPAIIETWGYDSHAVYCLTCAALDLASEWAWRLEMGDRWRPAGEQRVLDEYANAILAVVGGAP